MKRIFVALLSFVLILSMPIQVLNAKSEVKPPKEKEIISYLSLGDSIAYGLSATTVGGDSYFDLYSAYLDQSTSMNLAIPGATTSDLLVLLGTAPCKEAVEQADIITISIGGNNLLSPVIGYLFNAYSVSNIQDLQTAIIMGGTATSTAVINGMLLPTSPLAPLLTAGYNQYAQDIVLITQMISTYNPTAKLVFLNIYNPFPNDLTLPTNTILYTIMDSLVVPMNQTLDFIATSNSSTIKVLDVYNAFGIHQEAVDFDLDPLAFSLDIHPNTDGHFIIYTLLRDADKWVKHNSKEHKQNEDKLKD